MIGQAAAHRLFSYKMLHDTGFAPNPFFGWCTLATCKSSMRRSKLPGDWIAGFTSMGLNGDRVGEERLVYLMLVDEKLGLDAYHRDRRFGPKIPTPGAMRCVERTGDNIYFLEGGRMQQDPNPHHDMSNFDDDTSGEFALIARRFYYFDSSPLEIPPHLRPDVPRAQSAQGVRTHDIERAKAFLAFVDTHGGGVHSPPHRWPQGDESWRRS